MEKYRFCLKTLVETVTDLKASLGGIIESLSISIHNSGFMPNILTNFLSQFLKCESEFYIYGSGDESIHSLLDLTDKLNSEGIDRAIIAESKPQQHFTV